MPYIAYLLMSQAPDNASGNVTAISLLALLDHVEIQATSCCPKKSEAVHNRKCAKNKTKGTKKDRSKSKRKGPTRNRTGVARMSYTAEVMSIRTGSDNRYTIEPPD
jgi:hypothetical protein